MFLLHSILSLKWFRAPSSLNPALMCIHKQTLKQHNL